MKIFMMKNLYVFDFDDTIVSTGSLIRIMSPKDTLVRYMTSAEYADPSCPKHPSEEETANGYYEDFSDFDLYPPDPTVIRPIFDIFAELTSAGKNVVIVTARSNPDPVRRFLLDKGISSVPIFTVGGSDPKLKCDVVKELLSQYDPKKFVLFEDSRKNIDAISLMMENFSKISFKVIEVPHVQWLSDKRIRKVE